MLTYQGLFHGTSTAQTLVERGYSRANEPGGEARPRKPIAGITFCCARRVRAAITAPPSKGMKRRRCIPSSYSHNRAKNLAQRDTAAGLMGAASRTQYQSPSAHGGTAAFGSNPCGPGRELANDRNRRTSPIAARPGEGPLTEPTPAVFALGCGNASSCPRLCENTQEPTRQRIVFSIVLFPTAAAALFFFRLTKSRRIFYTQIECLCFHTGAPGDRQGVGGASPLR